MSGAEQMVKEVVERLGNNYEITLIAARLSKELPLVENRPAFKLVRVGLGNKTIDKILYPLLAALRVRKIKPEIAHAIMESYAGGALVLVKYFYPQAKRVLTLQSGDLDSDVKQKKFLVSFFWKIIHTSPNLVTSISSFLSQRAERLGVKKENIILTPNGVDLSQVPAGAEKIAKRVVCVARLSWEKGLDDLVKAWPEVLKSEPEAKLVLVGEGNKRQEIEKMIADLNIKKSVTLLGNLPHGQVLKEIKKSEVFICPSLAEGLGIVFIEAQACGVPVIGTRVGGIPDVIQDNENGLLIEPKSSAQIAEAIIKLLKDKSLSERLSQKALETVQKYDWQSVIKTIDSTYRELA